MCDYSLEMYGSRPAREGETYVTTRFPSGTIGFISPGDIKTAVCIACDTTLVLRGIPEGLRRSCGIGEKEHVTFVHFDEGLHRDGVRFKNGQEISLQRLRPGITAVVVPARQPPEVVNWFTRTLASESAGV
jgi:hypothetical protein